MTQHIDLPNVHHDAMTPTDTARSVQDEKIAVAAAGTPDTSPRPGDGPQPADIAAQMDGEDRQ